MAILKPVPWKLEREVRYSLGQPATSIADRKPVLASESCAHRDSASRHPSLVQYQSSTYSLSSSFFLAKLDAWGPRKSGIANAASKAPSLASSSLPRDARPRLQLSGNTVGFSLVSESRGVIRSACTCASHATWRVPWPVIQTVPWHWHL
ncbi:hypothetical protein B0H10DRAFT_1941029 [Mycena sp. CBHHK59/15]|nr:hypothetical protein B0H10DRAFT_1941029 [Mycena sp. CBHHK59/15]